jgi:protein-tyrosine phosphatase
MALMLPNIFEIATNGPGRLATMARPMGDSWLPDEMATLAANGVTDLVSNLTADEDRSLGLRDEAKTCIAAGMKFHRFPIGDAGLPGQPEFNVFIDTLVPIFQRGGFIVVHCRGGIGRSSVTAAALLIRLGMAPSDALAAIGRARGFPIPDTDEQREFVLALG